jgi:hypothetical protein
MAGGFLMGEVGTIIDTAAGIKLQDYVPICNELL